MAVRGKKYLVILFLVAAFLVSATVTLAFSERDPEKERSGHSHRSGGGGGGYGEYSIIFTEENRDPREMLSKCHQFCQGSTGEQERPECFRTCMQKYRREQGKRSGGDARQRERDFSKEQHSNNPYVFEDHHFKARLETELGSVRVLQKFTDRSELFRGIEKFRIAFLEAEPQTFIIPNHWDADALLFVANGEGTISLINQESRQSFNIKRGDLFRVPAGTTVYLINRHNNEKLVLAKILHSVSVPGDLQTFFGAGSDNPESSFFNAFSTEVLEAAFDTDRDDLEKLFRQRKQEQGIFKKASQEQIRSLSGEEGGRTWPFGERRGPYNIYKKNPSVQNDNGGLHEVDSDDLPDLRDINVAFSFFNITQGSIVGPFYYARTTTVLVVPDGEGQFEMACPHLSEQPGGFESGPRFEKVSSRLRRGTVVVVPAGHPVVIKASGDRNLEVIGFGLNSDENQWFPLAGRDNVISQWEDEAMELTFEIPATAVKKVVQKQNQKLFFKGPERRRRTFA